MALTFQEANLKDLTLVIQTDPVQLECFNKALPIYLENYEKNKQKAEIENNIAQNVLRDFLIALGFNPNDVGGQKYIDLAILKDESVRVIFECKREVNKNEMITQKDLNRRAMHEAILYYLRERENGNLGIKWIIICNFKKFFIFKECDFDEVFYKDKAILNNFQNAEKEKNNNVFYESLQKILNNKNDSLKCLYVSLEESGKNKEFSRIFSPAFLLDEEDPNRNNAPTELFYQELLYILGLKQNSDNYIVESDESKKNLGTLFTLIKQKLKPEQRHFENIIKLIVLWLNRILFLKLIEANLIKFNTQNIKDVFSIQKVKERIQFLNKNKIENYKDFEMLFFLILKKPFDKRIDKNNKFFYLPYLNSSLFTEQSIELPEHADYLLNIASLDEDKAMPYFAKTQLKTKDSKSRKSGDVRFLDYLLEFLNAFDFGSGIKDFESGESERVGLINATILGNVFERLNAYKDGSFYTPSVITTFMCRESLRKIVLERFNQRFKWNCTNFKDLRKNIDRNFQTKEEEFLAILKNIKVLDPAVGSGHFLASALNEMIHIYVDLGLNNFRTREFKIHNDEIEFLDRFGEPFKYSKDNGDEIQRALFNLKKNIIENNLFGVDINPNSIEICRLRLWIELLKSSYYLKTEREGFLPEYQQCEQLNTLPNIDINIKCGNSLISSLPLDKRLEESHKRGFIKNIIGEYQQKVLDYKNNCGNKKEVLNAIFKIKKQLTVELSLVLKEKKERFLKLIDSHFKLFGELELKPEWLDYAHKITRPIFQIQNVDDLSENDQKELYFSAKKIERLYTEIENILKDNTLQNSFEWRLEFPEVLNQKTGDFEGFDVIFGNPPYIRQEKIKEYKKELEKHFEVYNGTADIYTYFYELGFNLLKEKGILHFISSNKFCRAAYGENLREFLLDKTQILNFVDLNGFKIFEKPMVDTSLLEFQKITPQENATFFYAKPKTKTFNLAKVQKVETPLNSLNKDAFIFGDSKLFALKEKIEQIGTPLKEWDISINYGIKTGFNGAFIISTEKRNAILNNCSTDDERKRTDKIIQPILRGRDIRKYSYHWANLWLINTHNGYVENGVKIPPVNIDDYPALKEFLDGFYPQLEKRLDKGITPYNLRNCAYIKDFEKEKIIWAEMTKEPCFTWDDNNIFINQTCYFMDGSNKYMLGVLNSKLIYFYMQQIAVTLGDGAFRWIKQYIEKLPIPKITPQNQSLADAIVETVEAILKIKKENPDADTSDLENDIDSVVFKLYGLTENEIQMVSS